MRDIQRLQTEVCSRSTKTSDRIAASNHLQELIKLNRVDLMSCTTLLKSMMTNLSADSGRRLTGGDESSNKLDLHIIALQIIKSAVQVDCQKLLTANILTNDNVDHLFTLLDLSSSHSYCCYKAATVTWSKEQIKIAKELLEGERVEARITLSAQKSHLTDEMYTSSDIILSNGVRVSDEFIKKGISSLAHFREDEKGRKIRCKVCQVISPQYVWLQDLEDEEGLLRLSSKLSQRTMLRPADKTDKRVLIRLPESSVSFRGDVLKWERNQVSILATDYGWTTLLSDSLLYKLEPDEEEMSPGAILCNIGSVNVKTPQIKIQQLSLSILQHLAKIRNWSDIVFTYERNKPLLDMLKVSDDPEIVSTIITIQSLLVNSRGYQHTLESVMKASSKFMNCKSIMICATQYFRNCVVCKNESMFVRRKGLELVFTVLKNHPEDERIRNHCLIIFAKCFKGIEFESSKEEIKEELPSRSLYNAPPQSFRYHHMFNMGSPNRTRAFVNKLSNKADERKLSSEIASLLNSEGGEVFVGVDEGVKNSNKMGDITGLMVDREMRDKYNLFVDDVITDFRFMVHVTSGGKYKISQNFISAKFETIDNTYESEVKRGFKLEIYIVTVRPLTHGVCQGREESGRSVYYCRNESGIVDMHVNEIRQKLLK